MARKTVFYAFQLKIQEHYLRVYGNENGLGYLVENYDTYNWAEFNLKTIFCYLWVWFKIKYKYHIPIDICHIPGPAADFSKTRSAPGLHIVQGCVALEIY